MSQNPWKKAAEGSKPGGPPGGTVPPWMKAKTQQTQSSAPVQQNTPPPFKPPVQTNPVPANTNPATTQPATNAPPWMKNNQTAGTQPPANKPPGFAPSNPVPATSGNVPAWMKNKQATSPIATDRKQEEQKQKQQEELKLKLQQQEQQRKRKKQQEAKNQQRQRKMMQIEQQKSKLRQAQDKVKQSSKKSKLPKKGSPSKSNLKSPQKSRKNLSKLNSLFDKYIVTLNLACSKQQQYRQKIDYQKQFIQNLYKFTQNAKQGIVKYLQQRKITQRKRNIINLQDLLIQYAVVEALSGETGNIFFKIKSVELLQQKFAFYQVIFNIIIKLIKKLPIFRLRVPLMCRISYKGVQFLCESVSDQILDSVPSACENFIQIQGEVAQLQRQLNQAGYPFLNKKTFSAKKITVNGSDFYILYLVQNIANLVTTQNSSITNSSPLTFYPNCPLNFESLINLNLIASRSIHLTYSLMRQFQIMKTNAADKFKTSYLNLFQLAHAIRIVYASCQGQLQQQSFWGLVFQENNEIWAMIRRAYENIYGEPKQKQECTLKNKFILSKIIQTMVPVTFGIGKLKNSQPSYFMKRDQEQFIKVPAKIDNQATINSYPLQTLQIFEIIQLFDKYLQNSLKLKTAQQSNILQEDFTKLSGELYFKKIYVLINKAKLLFNKGNFREAIQLLQNYQFKKGKQMQKIIVYPLLITFYMMARQHKNFEDVQNQQQNKEKDNEKEKEKKQLMQQKNQKPKQDTQEAIKNEQGNQKQKVKDLSDIEKSKNQPQNENQKQKPQQDYEIRMLKKINQYLTYLSQLFEDQQQIWAHADIYTILATYYSKIKLDDQQQKQENQRLTLNLTNKKQQSKPRMFSNSHAFGQKSPNIQKQKTNNKMSQSRAQSQPNYEHQVNNNSKVKHPYHKECLKLLEITHRLCLQFYGSHSFNMAQYLFHQSQIYLNIYQYVKSQNSIKQALKIYKASSKHTKNLLSCSLVLGKSIVERGKYEKDNKLAQQGINILEKLTLDLSTLDMDNQVIEIFQYLCKSLQTFSNGSTNGDKNGKNNTLNKTQLEIHEQKNKSHKIQMYLQKIADISINNKNMNSLKHVIRQFVKNQLNFYSKDRTVTLKDLYDDYMKQQVPQNQQEIDKVNRLQELLFDLKQQKQIFGGFLEMIRWSLGIIKSKSDSVEWDRASQVLKKIFGLFQEKQIFTVLSF